MRSNHRPDRRLPRRAAFAPYVLTLSVLTLASCGLPGEERTRTVDDESVPYHLLEPAAPGGEAPSTVPSVSRGVPVVFWLRRDGLLTPAPVDASCDGSSYDVVEAVLGALAESPTVQQRDSGWASAIPPAARLELVAIADGVARVDLDPVALGDPERLPLAVGQLVLSVTSAPGVDALQMVTSGESVEVPLPGGALAAGPVTADDYVELLPPRLVASQGTTPTQSTSVGCPV